MPDCHLGKGATVGSVIGTKGAIIPAAVGVDVGCGMVAVKTKLFGKESEPGANRGPRTGSPAGAVVATGPRRRHSSAIHGAYSNNQTPTPGSLTAAFFMVLGPSQG